MGDEKNGPQTHGQGVHIEPYGGQPSFRVSSIGARAKRTGAMVKFILSFGIMIPVILAAISVWRSRGA
jgi:hypothetical protein